jgi:hypothetical protein
MEFRMAVQPTIVSYPGDGVTKNFTFQFDYISQQYVKVRVDGDIVPFTFTSAKAISVSTAPLAGQTLVITRETDRERLVDFTDGSVLIEEDLDLSALQAIHIVQEALDLSGASLSLEADGSLGASFRRISGLGDPDNERDAVTRRWAETAMSSQLQQASTERAAAETARSGAEGARDVAIGARDSASQSSAAALASKEASRTSEVNAASYRTQASASAVSAGNYRDAASQYRAETKGYRDEVVNTGATPMGRSIVAQDGLQGGGNLTADRGLSVDSTVARRTGYNLFTQNNQFTGGVEVLDNAFSLTRQNVRRWDVGVGLEGTLNIVKNDDGRGLAVSTDGNVHYSFGGQWWDGFVSAWDRINLNARGSVRFDSNGHFFVSTANLIELHWNNGLYFQVDNATGYRQFYVSTSDEKLKENIRPVPAEEAIAAVKALRPVTFEFIDGLPIYNPQGTHWGFTAQNVQEQFPSVVEEVGMPTTEDTYLGLTSSGSYQLISALTATVQHLLTEVEELKARLPA